MISRMLKIDLYLHDSPCKPVYNSLSAYHSVVLLKPTQQNEKQPVAQRNGKSNWFLLYVIEGSVFIKKFIPDSFEWAM